MVVLTSKVENDPLIPLIKAPLYLGPDNTIVFLISRETILYHKAKDPEMLKKLSPEIRSMIDSVNDMSGELLLVSKLR